MARASCRRTCRRRSRPSARSSPSSMRWPRPTRSSASSTSAIVASRFTENLEGRARCLVAHPVNPPHLVPIVELVGAPWTAPEIDRARQGDLRVGQAGADRGAREIEGFILNRLQGALLAEAFRLVGEGYVSPQDLDKTIKDGLGLRWSFMGPFETIELNAPGRHRGLLRALWREPQPPERSGPGHLSGREPRAHPRRMGLRARGPTRSRRACAGATGGSPPSRRTSGSSLPVDAAR